MDSKLVLEFAPRCECSTEVLKSSRIAESIPCKKAELEQVIIDLPNHNEMENDEVQHGSELVEAPVDVKSMLKLGRGEPVGSRSSRRPEDKPYACSHCPKRYKRKNTLTTHMNIHDKKRCIVCEICRSKVFDTRSKYKQHLLSHTGEKTHPCPICGQYFGLLGNMQKHMFVHDSEKRFPCPQCPVDDRKSFRTKGQLKNHMVSHTPDIRNFECWTCKKTFTRKSKLKVHENSHLAFKPYPCVQCEHRFAQSNDLKKHLKRMAVVGCMTCQKCGQQFEWKCVHTKHEKECSK